MNVKYLKKLKIDYSLILYNHKSHNLQKNNTRDKYKKLKFTLSPFTKNNF